MKFIHFKHPWNFFSRFRSFNKEIFYISYAWKEVLWGNLISIPSSFIGKLLTPEWSATAKDVLLNGEKLGELLFFPFKYPDFEATLPMEGMVGEKLATTWSGTLLRFSKLHTRVSVEGSSNSSSKSWDSSSPWKETLSSSILEFVMPISWQTCC